MNQAHPAIIDLTESAYDLAAGEEEWLSSLLRRGLPILDHGLGVAAWEYGRCPRTGDIEHRRTVVASGPSDFIERHDRAIASTPQDLLGYGARSGHVTTGSQDARALGRTDGFDNYLSHVDYCKDVLYFTAVNSRGAGVSIIAPLPHVTTFGEHEAHRWQMLAAHVEAGHRLREATSVAAAEPAPSRTLPHDAEAILDPVDFRLADAMGPARERDAANRLREAAVAVDRARSKFRKSDPERALEGWRALVRGRWSIVDWFDTDGRRYVLAIPNAPEVVDPRGLTEREAQVAEMAASGLSNKLIAYRLGLSTSHISSVVRVIMRKLGVKTRAGLARKMLDFPDLGAG